MMKPKHSLANTNVRIITTQRVNIPLMVGPNVETTFRTILAATTTVQIQAVPGTVSVQELAAGHTPNQVISGTSAKVRESHQKMFGLPAFAHKQIRRLESNATRIALLPEAWSQNTSVQTITTQVARGPSMVGQSVETSSRTIPARATIAQSHPVDGIKSVQELVAERSQCQAHSLTTSGINAKVKEMHQKIIFRPVFALKQISRFEKSAMRIARHQTTWLQWLAPIITTQRVKDPSMAGPSVVT